MSETGQPSRLNCLTIVPFTTYWSEDSAERKVERPERTKHGRREGLALDEAPVELPAPRPRSALRLRSWPLGVQRGLTLMVMNNPAKKYLDTGGGWVSFGVDNGRVERRCD